MTNVKTFRHVTVEVVINRLFANCKGGNLIFISGRGSAISSSKEGKSGFIYNLVKSVSGRANVRAFHENPNRIHTKLTFIYP